MDTYPITIDNGGGEKLTFVRLVEDPDGDYLEVENEVKPGAGPQMHVHYHQDESLTVHVGSLGYQILGQEAQTAGPGETVAFAANVAHRFWNAGNELLRCSGRVKPPGNIVYFLTELYASTKANGGKQPDPFDGAFLVTHFKSEFGLLGLPSFVANVILPVQYQLGKMLGKYQKYADAPPAVTK